MSSASPVVGVAFGRYVLLEKIAVGGMAEIFRAQYRADQDFEKIVVIKRILPHLANNEEFITMFRDEAKVNVRLTHANIVQVFDFGRQGNDYYLAMEFVQGQNLRRVIKRATEIGSAALPVPLALYIAQESAKGLAYAHSRKDNANKDLNIIHRDVTPSNILLSYEGEVKITDFGIAKASSKTGSTQQGMVKGKAPYLAPEQLNPKLTPDARLDVYALGAVTWEMLTGRRLVPGETDMEVLGNLMGATSFPRPSQIKSSIPVEVDRAVMKALERDPDQRYPSAAAYQKELSAIVSRFAMTSSECASFMARLFATEIEEEASRSVMMPVVDTSAVSKGAEQEATRTRQSQRDPRDERPTAQTPSAGILGGGKTATKLVTPTHAQPIAPAKAAESLASWKEPQRKSPVLPLALGGVAVIIAILALLIWRPWGGTTPVATPTPTPVVAMTPAPTASPAAIETATPVPTNIAVAVATKKLPRGTPTPKATPAAAIATIPPPASTPVASTASGSGLLAIDSEPWGEIYIDGRKTGRETPAFDLEVPAGRHEIRIVNDVQRLEIRFTVDIKNGDKQKRGTVKLAPKK